MSQPSNLPEKPKLEQTVLEKVQGMIQRGIVTMPPDYAVENAIKSALLWVQTSDQRDKLLACTPESKENALYDMVLQCGDLSKKTGYLIPYGSRMIYQRSYFGDEALAKRVRPGIEVYGDVVYKGEKLVVAKARNRYGLITQVKEHEQVFPRESKEIVACYVGVVDENGEDMGVELMDMDQIRNSWKKSKQYGPNSQTFHNEQPDIACKRTVLRRRMKVIISTSTDEWLLQAINNQELDTVEAEMQEEIASKANGTLISMPPPALQEREEVIDKATGESQSVAISAEPVTSTDTVTPELAENTEEGAEAPKKALQKIELTLTENEEVKALYSTKKGEDLFKFKARAEKEGVVTFDALMARIAALPGKEAVAGEEPY